MSSNAMESQYLDQFISMRFDLCFQMEMRRWLHWSKTICFILMKDKLNLDNSLDNFRFTYRESLTFQNKAFNLTLDVLWVYMTYYQIWSSSIETRPFVLNFVSVIGDISTFGLETTRKWEYHAKYTVLFYFN